MHERLVDLRDTTVVREATRRAMRGNVSTDTSIEKTFRKALFKHGLRGYRKNVRSMPGSPDVVFGRYRVAVFVHGCFWHQCPHCKRNLSPGTNKAFWQAKFESNRIRDERNVTRLEELGYATLVVWECQLKSDLDSAVAAVAQCLSGRHQSVKATQQGS